MIPISFASFIGTLIFGPMFDTIGRKKMIIFTCIFIFYIDCGASLLLFINSILFYLNAMNLIFNTILWFLIFIIATSGASSAHLTISEIFPLVRNFIFRKLEVK